MAPPMEVTTYAFLRCIAPNEARDPLPGILEGSPSGYDSIGGFTDTLPTWTMPALLLLRANRNHLLGPL